MSNFDVKATRAWCSGRPQSEHIAVVFAALDRDVHEVSIETILSEVERQGGQLLRRDVTAELRALDRIGAGRFIIGRRGNPTRFHTPIGIRRLGHAALGELVDATPDDGAGVVRHMFVVRPGFEITLVVPRDLTEAEARRLARYIELLPFEETKTTNY